MEKDRSELDNIKSIYIIKTIFYTLNRSIFLNFINYNKKIQNKLCINIEDYKNLGNRTKIIENNGLGKEYKLNTDILIFEGEYLHGKKNGKGKEFYENGQIKFEGEYLNGKILNGKGYDDKGNLVLVIDKNGNGIEFYKNGKMQFEGKYYNGKRWNGKVYNYRGKEVCELKYGTGVITEYGYNGQKLYEGNYINGKRNGKGKEFCLSSDNSNIRYSSYNPFYDSINTWSYIPKNNIRFKFEKEPGFYDNYQIKFEGEYTDGERNGKGIEYYENKQIKFEGEYLNGKIWNGIGYNKYGEKAFEIKDGKGNIMEYDEKGILNFKGEYLRGERNGKGEEYHQFSKFGRSNLKFEGEYLNGKKNGKGKEYNKHGKIKFEGEYLNGERNGKGIEYHKNRQIKFEGEYLNGKRNGKGKEYSLTQATCYKGILAFEGEYLNGKREGKGKEYYNNKLVFEGEYKNGKRNGKGKEYYFKYGNLKLEGEYKDGSRHGKGKEYYFGNIVFEGEYEYGWKKH